VVVVVVRAAVLALMSTFVELGEALVVRTVAVALLTAAAAVVIVVVVVVVVVRAAV